MLHPLPQDSTGIKRPARFTYPYQYVPHPLCQIAAGEVRKYLAGHPTLQTSAQEGKMFGVLVVEDKNGQQFFLAAYSGELAGDNKWEWFVPPIYDLLDPSSYFQEEQSNINALTRTIAESVEGMSALKTDDLSALKTERKQRSQALQQWLFRQYRVLDFEGQEADFIDIFSNYHRTFNRGSLIPPSGSGECCAPKLLQAAYQEGLKPLAMAEFWIGRSPKDELRIDGHYYPACSGRCRPILHHMLRGLDIEDNPLLERNRRFAEQLRVIHVETDTYGHHLFAIISKPSGMLSVPGNDTDIPTVYDIVRQRFPDATGPIIVHRLDMDTSGLMVVALDEAVYHHLQDQFITHKVQKRYIALLDNISTADVPTKHAEHGVIDLPICPNPYDRPRQMVSEEYGKRAITRFLFFSPDRAYLWPQTGRTHQLRVHCAHPQGLGRPIAGDPLYGAGSQATTTKEAPTRLCLHADTLIFSHPRTGDMLEYHDSPPF